ncbi:carbohydrate-binding protein [Parafrankia sp. CH37]|uniref:carbohydrate-binding protein n=1 Tax=Parafrankia sp. CH37 TaxID=683308 RepID=UPI0037CBCA4F
MTTERDNASNKIALNSILRIDPSAAGSTLTATAQWDLTSEYPWLSTGNSTEANLGFEGVTYVPDSYLTANGFVDQHTGAAYDPANYPGHGAGLFFAALESNGNLYAYALGGNGSFTRIAIVSTGLPKVQDVQYDPDLGRIWALCDNDCAVTSTLLKIDSTGSIVPEKVFSRPAGLPDNNIEGFAVAPVGSAGGQTREVVWGDDGIYGAGVGSATNGHALYAGTLNVDLGLGAQGVPTAGVSPSSAPVGSQITVTGKGFAPGETVDVALTATPGSLDTAVANSTGGLSTTVTVPAGAVLGADEIVLTGQTSGITAQAALVVLPATWVKTKAYNAGDKVSYNGRTYLALYYTSGETPGSRAAGAWAEYATDAAGNVLWTATGVFKAGDVVLHDGIRWVAQYYSRGQVPGSSPNISWKVVVDNANPAPWIANSVYVAGDKVTYEGHTYQAQWYNAAQVPTNSKGAWKLVG